MLRNSAGAETFRAFFAAAYGSRRPGECGLSYHRKPPKMTGIDLPSIGCREIAARYTGHSPSFVVSVEP